MRNLNVTWSRGGVVAALVWLAALGAGACNNSPLTEHTAVVVEVRAVGLIAGSDLDQVVASVGGGAPLTFALASSPSGDKVTFPFRFGVVPRAAATDVVDISVVGRWMGADKVATSSRVGFVKNEAHLLVLTLYAACVGKAPPCAPGTRCLGNPLDATVSTCTMNQDDVTKLPPIMQGGTGGTGGNKGNDGGGGAVETDGGSGGGGGEGNADAGDDGGAGGSGGAGVDGSTDGPPCADGSTRMCSCGMMAGGNQSCAGGHWGACVISCGSAGLMGRCAAGTRTCDDAKAIWGNCSIAPASADTCATGNDDNCNGVPNEGCGCVAGQTQTCDKSGLFGKCAAGMQTCDAAGKWSACSITAAAGDTCVAGNDDNCNGKVNEGCPCVNGATRPCSEGGLFGKCAAGMQTCGDSKWSACSIAPSTADSCVPDNDDNCNGLKNEGCGCVQNQTRPCSQGGLFGKCAGGKQTCDAAGKWGACSIAPSAVDSCTPGNDDNCNGRVNEGCACTVGQGRTCGEGGAKGNCALGGQSCQNNGQWGPCSISPAAADGCDADDDATCNGVPHEGCTCVNGTTQSCAAGGLYGKCKDGIEKCAVGKWGACSITPSSADTCVKDNDDNCNGKVNEGCPCVTGDTRFCSAGGLSGKCKDGTEACAGNGTWGACSITPSANDTCVKDNDDNCNGTKNDGCTCVIGVDTRSCASDGAQGTCASGTEACVSPGTWGACSIQAAGADNCTSLDNDDNCDGVKSCACVNGTTRGCGSCGGSQTCSGGQWGGCGSCCPVAINDKWAGYDLRYDSTPWAITWPPSSSGAAKPTTETASGGGVVMPRDSVIGRSGLTGGYIFTFTVAPDDTFTIHTNIGAGGPGAGPFPAFRRAGANSPITLGGLAYGRDNTFGSFGAWTGQPVNATARVTIYVKAGAGQVAAFTDFAPASGFVAPGGFNATQFSLVGSNLPEYDGSLKVGRFSNIVGCAGLTDAQVDSLYSQRKTYP